MLKNRNLVFLATIPMVLANCVHVKPSEVKPQPAFAVGKIQSLEMRKLTPMERVRKLKNGDDLVTNACGNSVVKFEITKSTSEVEKYLTDKDRIGEWCKPHYDFEVGTYFLVVDLKNREVLDSAPLEVESNALLIHPEQAQNWRDDYGHFPIELQWVELEEPKIPPYPLNAYDPNIIEYIGKFDYLHIEYAESGRPRIVQTHGYKLSDIFLQNAP
jgi:hypothetical protein